MELYGSEAATFGLCCNSPSVILSFSDDRSSSNLSDAKASQGSDDDEDEMVTEVLQFNQLSLEEFCMILLSRTIHMFKGSSCANSAVLESAVNLLHEVLSLMKSVFPVDLWRCGTQLNSLMVSDGDGRKPLVMLQEVQVVEIMCNFERCITCLHICSTFSLWFIPSILF